MTTEPRLAERFAETLTAHDLDRGRHIGAIPPLALG